jgi:hypothetical protein
MNARQTDYASTRPDSSALKFIDGNVAGHYRETNFPRHKCLRAVRSLDLARFGRRRSLPW